MTAEQVTSVSIDRVDEQILTLLQNDGRLSNRALAQRIHLSPSSAWARVDRLIKSGVISGFRAEVDPAAVGRPLEAVIALRYRADHIERQEQFVAEIAALPQTLSLLNITGANDFLLHVALPDTAALRRFALDLLRRPEVDHIETSLAFVHVRGGAVLPPSET